MSEENEKLTLFCLECGKEVEVKEDWVILNSITFKNKLMKKKNEKKIWEIKRKMESAGLGELLQDGLVFMPIIPMNGTEKTLYIHEYMGVKVAEIISPSDD